MFGSQVGMQIAAHRGVARCERLDPRLGNALDLRLVAEVDDLVLQRLRFCGAGARSRSGARRFVVVVASTSSQSDREKIVSPHAPDHLLALALAGAIGFAGNEIAAQLRLPAGREMNSPALIADGYHARTDGVVSLGVMLTAALVALGAPIADPIIAIVITGVILRITCDPWLWRLVGSREILRGRCRRRTSRSCGAISKRGTDAT